MRPALFVGARCLSRGSRYAARVVRRVGYPARGSRYAAYVESYNRSRGLFERLGFVKSGEQGYSYLLEWRPQPEAHTP